MALTIHSPAELGEHGGNRFLGTLPQMYRSTITFADTARNNIIFCEDNVSLSNSSIQINGSNALIYLSSSRYRYQLTVLIHNNSVLYLGRNNPFTTVMHIILSEQKHCFIGDDGLIATDVWIRNADPHLIYSCETGKRLNPTRSIFIGDYVWLGQSARILKGTQIDSGSIVGGGSVVPGKKIGHNTSWAGNPCRCIKDGVFWDRSCVHAWLDEQTQISEDWNTFIAQQKELKADAFIFGYDPDQYIPFDEMDRIFSTKNVEEKLEYLRRLPRHKNRFVRPEEPARRKAAWPWKRG